MRALCEIDARIEADSLTPIRMLPQLHTVYAPWQAADIPQLGVPTEQADGCVAAEYVWAYPPGIPLVVPGEMITDELLESLAQMQASGTELHSTSGGMPQTLIVLED